MTATATEQRSIRRPAPQRARANLVRVVVGLVAVLLVAEIGARLLLAEFLDPPDGWNLRGMHAQVAEMERLSEVGGVEVLLLGSSVLGSGVDPELLVAGSTHYGSAYNLWLPGAPVRSLEVLYEQVAAPLLTPRVVVVGVTAREFNANGNGQERNVRALLTSPELRRLNGIETPLQRADRWFRDKSALVRLRSTLRDPGRLVLALQAGKQDGGDRPSEPWRSERPPYQERDEHMDQERRALRNYQPEGVEVDALRRLVGSIRQDGSQVVLVNMPVYDAAYNSLFPRGTADREAYEAVFSDVCAELSVECLDLAGDHVWSQEDFTNVNHASRAGTERITSLLAAALDASP